MGYRVDSAAIERKLQVIARREVERVANDMRNELVTRTPRDSGRTANAWEIEVSTGPGLRAQAIVKNGVRTETGLLIWRLLEQGTGRYGPRGRDIVPVRRKALRWRAQSGAASRSSGGFVYAARSRGMRPDPFVRDAITAVQARHGWRIRYSPGDTTQ